MLSSQHVPSVSLPSLLLLINCIPLLPIINPLVSTCVCILTNTHAFSSYSNFILISPRLVICVCCRCFLPAAEKVQHPILKKTACKKGRADLLKDLSFLPRRVKSPNGNSLRFETPETTATFIPPTFLKHGVSTTLESYALLDPFLLL